MEIKHYLQQRHYWEAGLWFLYFAVHLIANIAVASMDVEGRGFASWEPIVWEVSSNITIASLLVLILWFEQKHPITLKTVKRAIPVHMLFTLVFCGLHVVIMVKLRELSYWIAGGHYDFGHWGWELFYEYLKDFRTYFSLLGIVYLYRFVLFRMQGEVSLLDNSETTEAANDPLSKNTGNEHLLVKKLGKEFLVRIQDIEWLEACGNYVNLHVSDRVYPYRGTMKSLENRLDNAQFMRIHRSYMVNLQEIKSIQPLESGDAKIQLRRDQELPLSRRYRAELKQLC